MATPKPPAATVYTWLKANLGTKCLAPLTGTDARALQAAVQIMELYSYDRAGAVLSAFGAVVERMQPHTRELAYHAIAMVLDWSDRGRVWAEAGLPELGNVRWCKFEPGALSQVA